MTPPGRHGFTHRLPGTGAGLPAADPNLRLRNGLEPTATGSDLNIRFRFEQAEFPGVKTAKERTGET